MNNLLENVKKEAVEIDRYMRLDLESMESEIDPLLKRVLDYGLFPLPDIYNLSEPTI